MNEDGTPIEDVEESTENISAADGGITTTPEEVEKLLNLPHTPVKESDDDSEDEKDESGDNGKYPETPNTPETPELPKVPEIPEPPKKNEDESENEVPTFEMEVEDANGVKLAIKPGDNLEEIFKDFEPKSNGQIFAILDKFNELKSQKATYDKDQEQKAVETEKQERLAAIQTGWDNEIKALQGAKRIDITTTDKPNERVEQVFKYMNEENDKRIADGRPLIQSFEDALDKLELKETKEAEKQRAEEAKELARKKGSIVGGSSSPATSGEPIYKGGARNANEALRVMGILK